MRKILLVGPAICCIISTVIIVLAVYYAGIHGGGECDNREFKDFIRVDDNTIIQFQMIQEFVTFKDEINIYNSDRTKLGEYFEKVYFLNSGKKYRFQINDGDKEFITATMEGNDVPNPNYSIQRCDGTGNTYELNVNGEFNLYKDGSKVGISVENESNYSFPVDPIFAMVDDRGNYVVVAYRLTEIAGKDLFNVDLYQPLKVEPYVAGFMTYLKIIG